MKCEYNIIYLNTLWIRLNNKEKRRNVYGFPYFIRNQWFKNISIRIKEIKDIEESYQIPAIPVVKMRYLKKYIFYERGNIKKEKIFFFYRFPYFIRNQWFKDIFIRSIERKEINEKYVLISVFFRNKRFLDFLKIEESRGN